MATDDTNTAGAWAAAAVVLALGGLAFGVTAHLRAADLESRLDRVEAAAVVSPPVAETVTPTDDPDAEDDTTTTSVAPDDTAAVASGEPPDPEVARRSVTVAFETVYDGSRPTSERVGAVDDPEGVGRALSRVAAGPFADAATAVSVVVDNVSFTSDTRAIVSYTLSVLGLTDVSPRRGEARIVGGRWAVTRATVCTDLSALGASCA